MAETTSVRKILIKVDTAGNSDLKELANSMGGLNKKVSGISDSFSTLKNAVIGFFVATKARELIALSDSMQLLSSRIAVLSGGSNEAARVFEGLLKVANQTKTSVDGLATIYSRLAASTKELNLSQGSLLQLTKFLQNSYRLSGATAEEASNGTVQFTQALALGVLRGQDFKSVLSQNVVIGDVLTKSLGKTRGALQKMAEEGKLTNAVVLPALYKAMDDVNGKADELGQTFDQTLTVALNNFKIAIKDLNENNDLSGKFAKFVDTSVKRLTILARVFVEFKEKYQDFKASLIEKLPEGALDQVQLDLFGIGKALQQNADYIDDIGKAGSVGQYYSNQFDSAKTSLDGFRSSIIKSLISVKEFFGGDTSFEKKGLENIEARKNAILDLGEAQIQNSLTQRFLLKQNEEAEKKQAQDEFSRIKNVIDLETKRANLINSLNVKYSKGKISISDYYTKLEGLDKQIANNKFLKGKLDLEQYNNELDKLTKRDLNRVLKDGYISIQQFNQATERNGIKSLNDDLEAGKISLLEYDAALVKISTKFESNSSFRTGINDYIKSIGTLSSGIAGAVTATFTRLEDALVEFTKSGKFNFQQFTQAVLDDLNRIIIRSLIIKPLAEGLLGAIGTNNSSASGTSAGGAYSTPGVAFAASGGVFDSPTPFSYGRGKLGVLGESGPEAIIPLKRGSDGSLGISGAGSSPVVVNITNMSGGEVEQKETAGPNGEKILDVIIHAKVKEGLASGQYDRSLGQAFGLKRRGQ